MDWFPSALSVKINDDFQLSMNTISVKGRKRKQKQSKHKQQLNGIDNKMTKKIFPEEQNTNCKKLNKQVWEIRAH